MIVNGFSGFIHYYLYARETVDSQQPFCGCPPITQCLRLELRASLLFLLFRLSFLLAFGLLLILLLLVLRGYLSLL